jgi:hypothetical protein
MRHVKFAAEDFLVGAIKAAASGRFLLLAKRQADDRS